MPPQSETNTGHRYVSQVYMGRAICYRRDEAIERLYKYRDLSYVIQVLLKPVIVYIVSAVFTRKSLSRRISLSYDYARTLYAEAVRRIWLVIYVAVWQSPISSCSKCPWAAQDGVEFYDHFVYTHTHTYTYTYTHTHVHEHTPYTHIQTHARAHVANTTIAVSNDGVPFAQ